MTLFYVFFLMNDECNDVVLNKTHHFIKKEMVQKKYQSLNRPLICDLFNQILNCNFDFKKSIQLHPYQILKWALMLDTFSL